MRSRKSAWRVGGGVLLALCAIGMIPWKPALTLAACAGAAGLSPGARGGENKVTETVEKRLPADGVDALQVTASAGSIVVRVAPDGASEVHVTAKKLVSGNASAAELRTYLDRIPVTADPHGRVLVVESRVEAHTLPPRISAWVSYTATVPKRLALRLTSMSGDVEAHGTSGGGAFRTMSGEIALRGVSGPDITATSLSGSVTATDLHAEKALELTTTSGDVKMRSCAAGELRVKSTSGNIVGDLTAAVPFQGADLRTLSGDIDVTLPRSAAARIEASTLSGEISVPGATRTDGGPGRRSVRVRGDKDGPTIKAGSLSGNVTMRER
jgi:hypothetical protein